MFKTAGVILLLICGLFTFSTANSVSTDEEDCPQLCGDNYPPVCATNGKIYKEFSNNCELKASNCRLERSARQKYVATVMDWCSTEFVDNLDRLVEKLDNLDLQMPECLKPCPLIYSPVCISNGQYRALISNECIVDGFNCALAKKGKASFRVLQNNSC